MRVSCRHLKYFSQFPKTKGILLGNHRTIIIKFRKLTLIWYYYLINRQDWLHNLGGLVLTAGENVPLKVLTYNAFSFLVESLSRLVIVLLIYYSISLSLGQEDTLGAVKTFRGAQGPCSDTLPCVLEHSTWCLALVPCPSHGWGNQFPLSTVPPL